MRIEADFEGGNLAMSEVVAPNHVRVAARPDGSPRPLWFAFSASGVRASELTIELVNADECLGPRYGWNTARPVYRVPGGDWERCGGGEYVEQPAEDRPGGVFRFLVPCARGSVSVAYCYPYTPSDLAGFRVRLADYPLARWAVIGRTPAGAPVDVLRVGDPDARRSVWVLARQHAGETPGSFALEGMVEWLLGSGRMPDALFCFAPMVDRDGAGAGRYGKDTPPVDFNRDWQEDPTRPEIAALVHVLERDRLRAGPHVLALDLHASHHGDTSCYVFLDPTAPDGAQQARQERFLELLELESPPAVGFHRSDLRAEPAPAGSAREFHARRYAALSLCVEFSYHLAQSGRYLTRQDYRDFGGALARSALFWLDDVDRA